LVDAKVYVIRNIYNSMIYGTSHSGGCGYGDRYYTFD
jgi:hypothetical protein